MTSQKFQGLPTTHIAISHYSTDEDRFGEPNEYDEYSNGREAPASIESNKSKESGDLSNSITISRDQTAASSFQKDQLLALGNVFVEQDRPQIFQHHTPQQQTQAQVNHQMHQQRALQQRMQQQQMHQQQQIILQQQQQQQKAGLQQEAHARQQQGAATSLQRQAHITPHYPNLNEPSHSVESDQRRSAEKRDGVVPLFNGNSSSGAVPELPSRKRQRMSPEDSAIVSMHQNQPEMDRVEIQSPVKNRALEVEPLTDSLEKLLEQLQRRSEYLEREVVGLKQQAMVHPRNSMNVTKQGKRWQVLYRFETDDIFLGEPSWVLGEGKELSLRGNLPLSDLVHYFRRHDDIAFVIYKTYSPDSIPQSREKEILEDDVLQPPEPVCESLQLITHDMRQALQSFLSSHSDFGQRFQRFDLMAEIAAPYLFWYCYRPSHSQALQGLEAKNQALICLLSEWIETKYRHEYEYADTRLSQGFTSRKLMTYMVRPGDVIFSQEKKGISSAYVATSWAFDEKKEKSAGSSKSSKDLWSWKVGVWSHSYDGTFYKTHSTLDIQLHLEGPDDEVSMRDLKLLPLRFASPESKQRLEIRGQTFWRCRYRRFISYRVEGNDDPNNVFFRPGVQLAVRDTCKMLTLS